ncbi:hypothetical protein ACP70R_019729 [Stipagrostis hirtigluma subsp. patula]
MPPRKRLRGTCTPRGAAAATVPASPPWALPADVLLEIVALSDADTVVRCAASCRPLRRSILSPDFLRRVRDDRDGVLPSSGGLLCFLDKTTATLSLVHPAPAAAPAAASFVESHLSPFVSRSATDLLEHYSPVTSRGGLVLLEQLRSADGRRQRSRDRCDMCVYDPMTGGRAFLPYPPDIGWDRCTYVLLTAADDGVKADPFLLLAVDTAGLEDCLPFGARTVSPDANGGKWGPVAYSFHPNMPKGNLVGHDNSAVVLNGVVHWLMSDADHVLTYNVDTSAVGSIRLPSRGLLLDNWRAEESRLWSSEDGRLGLLTMNELTVSVWMLLAGGVWARHVELDTTAMVRSLMDPAELARHYWVDLESSGDQRSGVVLMRLQVHGGRDEALALDMATRQIHGIGDKSGVPCVVDMASRLQP